MPSAPIPRTADAPDYLVGGVLAQGGAGRGGEGEPRDRLAAGTVLGNTFQICNVIASGGMGVVYEATHIGGHPPGRFAVKALRRDLIGIPGLAESLRREAETLSRIDHDNVVQCYGFGVAGDGTPYLVMDRLEGRDLAEMLAHGLPSVRRTAALVREMAAALTAAHARGVVHCDLKPANVILQPAAPGATEDEVDLKLIDFGVAKAAASPCLADDGAVVGTPSYMAPEQARGRVAEVGPKADQFALAVTAYELLTGRTPFPGAEPRTVMRRIIQDAPRPLGDALGCPAHATEMVLRRALEKRPEDRFATVAMFARAFDMALRADTHDFTMGRPSVGRAALSLVQRSSIVRTMGDGPLARARLNVAAQAQGGWSRRRPGKAASRLAALAAAVAILLLGAGSWRPSRSQAEARAPEPARVLAVACFHTDANGASSTAAEPGTNHPRSNESGSAQP